MSGALETAGGALAIFSVIDVIIRTGVELHQFLQDILAAPQNLQRLDESIAETVLLVKALQKRAKVQVDIEILDSVTGAIKSVNRELNGVQSVLSRLKAGNRTWTRVKYVLDEKRITKAIQNLEQSKSLLVNAMVIIYGGSSVEHLARISQLSAQLDQKLDTLTTKLMSQASPERDFDAKLDDLVQQISKREIAHQQALQSQLKKHHQQYRVIEDKNHQKLMAIHCNQTILSSRQDHSIRASLRAEKTIAQVKEEIHVTSHVSRENHRKTRGLIRDLYERLNNAQSNDRVNHRASGNKVYFYGERPDMIMSYLLPIKDEFDSVVDLVAEYPDIGAPIREIVFLHQQFERLLGSAAQEAAGRFAMSTATSFDQWYFSKNGFKSILDRPQGLEDDDHELAEESPGSFTSNAIDRRSKRIPSVQTLSFDVHSGRLDLFLSKGGYMGRNKDVCNVDLSFTSHAHSFTAIDIQFARLENQNASPQISAQLNVFTLASNSQWLSCRTLFETKATVQDIDEAFRKGVISPYHVDTYGDSVALFEATKNGRYDVLKYLESQGIGVTNLRQESSVIQGLTALPRSVERDQSLSSTALSTFQYARVLLEDSTVMLADLVLICIWIMYSGSHLMLDQIAIFNSYLLALHNEGFDCAKFRLDQNPANGELRWDRDTFCELISVLVESGTDVHTNRITNVFSSALMSNFKHKDQKQWALEDLFYAMAQGGADIHTRDYGGQTPSVAARRLGIWSSWCQSLVAGGRNIREVLQREGNEWLLDDNWENACFERYGDYYQDMGFKLFQRI